MEELFGLPAHPLLVHFPIVAIPTFTLLALAAALNPTFRDRFGKLVLALGVVTAIATILAAQSGEALAETYANDDFVDEHASLGETLRLLVFLLALAFGVLLFAGKRAANAAKDPFTLVVSAIVVGLAIMSAVWTVRTGHEGARLTWGNTATEPAVNEVEAASEAEAAAAAAAAAAETTAAPTTTATATTTAAPDDAAPETTAAPTTTEAAATDPVVAIDGQAIYEANCSNCHGDMGQGARAKAIHGVAEKTPDKSLIITLVSDGGQQMPAFGNKLSEEEIVAVVDYIYDAFPTAPAE